MALAQASAAFQGGEFAEARRLFTRILKADSGHLDARFGLAVVLLEMGKAPVAIPHLRTLLKAAPNGAQIHNYLGIALQRDGQAKAAIGAFQTAVRLDPANCGAWNDLGCLFRELGDLAAAADALCRAIQADPRPPSAHENLALVRIDQGDLQGAKAVIDARLAHDPTHVRVLLQRADLEQRQDRLADAQATCEQAVALAPDRAEAHRWLGTVLWERAQPEAAVAAFEHACALDPDGTEAAEMRVHLYQTLCAWKPLERAMADLAARVKRTPTAHLSPLLMLGTSFPAVWQRANAERFAAAKTGAIVPERPRDLPVSGADDRITVAYLSGDFRQHPVSTLAVEMFERHDRQRYRVLGYGCGPSDDSDLRHRVVAAFDGFADLTDLSDRAAIERIRADGVDVLVDLNGPTRHGRPGILARRAAPIQVMYLGFCGTSGAPYMDYVVVDPWVVPPAHREALTEAPVYLPDTFMVTDSRRPALPVPPSRAEAGLPVDGVVFCGFNQPHKITPAVFRVWMEILTRVPHGVLWLRRFGDTAMANLKREAAVRGVDAERLVFAPKVPDHAAHLARHQLADLFLDTTPYNAHTGACDALRMGLPVLTCGGDTFASRVAGSLVGAVGLPELRVDRLDAYRQTAVELGNDPAQLHALRQTLAARLPTAPLFDCGRFTRHLEDAYGQMWVRHTEGRPPAPIDVAPRDR